jgi:hypothetical protein
MNHCVDFYRADKSRLKANIELFAQFQSYLDKFESVTAFVDVTPFLATLSPQIPSSRKLFKQHRHVLDARAKKPVKISAPDPTNVFDFFL